MANFPYFQTLANCLLIDNPSIYFSSHCQWLKLAPRKLAAIFLLLTIAGCASSPANDVSTLDNPSDQSQSTLIESDEMASQREIPIRPLTADSLLSLLIGELAVHHRDLNTAAKNYIDQARLTKDTGIAARASQLARYQRNVESSYEMAKLWYELAPTDEPAMTNYADILARFDRPLEAIEILTEQLLLNQVANFGVLRHSQFKSSENALEQALEKITILNSTDHDNFTLLFSHTLLLQKNGQHQAALAQLRKLKKFDSEPVHLAILESRLLNQLERHQDAAKILEDAINAFPDQRKLNINYAQTLTHTKPILAETIYQKLLLDTPSDIQLRVAHSLIATDNKHYDAAKESLNKLTQSKREKDFANFQLGLIAKQQNNSELALSHFKAVNPGKYFLSATHNTINTHIERDEIAHARKHTAELREKHPIQAPVFWVLESKILIDQQDIQGAHDILTLAVNAFPEQIMLRLERSNISELLDDLPLIEKDLRFVISRDPNNVLALNALGYTLTVRTTRYREAIDLIQKAVILKPDSAAIRDSLGWVQFKLNKLEDAEKNLSMAFNQEQEDEIAAHLIELYWTTGQKRRAKKAYKKIDKLGTPHPLVDNALQRLGINY